MIENKKKLKHRSIEKINNEKFSTKFVTKKNLVEIVRINSFVLLRVADFESRFKVILLEKKATHIFVNYLLFNVTLHDHLNE